MPLVSLIIKVRISYAGVLGAVPGPGLKSVVRSMLLAVLQRFANLRFCGRLSGAGPMRAKLYFDVNRANVPCSKSGGYYLRQYISIA